MKNTKKDARLGALKIDEINDAIANDAAMRSRIAIDAASAAANADKKDDKNTDELMGRIFKKGTAGYQAERKKILEGLAEDGMSEMKEFIEQVIKNDEADKNDNKKNDQATGSESSVDNRIPLLFQECGFEVHTFHD